MSSTEQFLQKFTAARAKDVPLIAVLTSDRVFTIDLLQQHFSKNQLVFHWDVINGVSGLTDESARALMMLNRGSDLGPKTVDPVSALKFALDLPERSILFFSNAHRFISDRIVAQAIGNLREPFKTARKTLVLLAPQIDLPLELQHDVLQIDMPFPSSDELRQIVLHLYEHTTANLELPSNVFLQKAVDALRGLSPFSAEQAAALAFTKTGIDLNELWYRKRQMINQTPGLSVWAGEETFDDVGGVVEIKRYLEMIITGRNPPRAIILLDELEKQVAGVSGDTSGVSQALMATMLTHMQDRRYPGLIFIGPPGTSKSFVAQAAGNTFGLPTIAFDLSSVKSSLVGDSEARLRMCFRTIDAVSDGNALFIGTVNSTSELPSAYQRRFYLGEVFFDVPSDDERRAIWKIWKKKYHLTDESIPPDDDWVGADIWTCCNLAYRLNCTLIQASERVVPVAVSARGDIDALRKLADGRLLSASYPGVYRQPDTRERGAVKTKRRLDLD